MKETKHTPGPWIVRSHEPWVIAKDHGDLKSVAHLNYPVEQTSTQKANARLIAAAPELYNALEKLASEACGSVELDSWPELQECLSEAHAALSKADPFDNEDAMMKEREKW